ncbi:MAG: hypothetical protein AAB224_01285 [Gemmatimonadota bacterium]|mgnify:FL=1
MPNRSSIKRGDLNQVAARVAALATGGKPAPAKNPAAVALGRLGGLKGGKARAATLSAAQRSKIAKKAAAARWKTEP